MRDDQSPIPSLGKNASVRLVGDFLILCLGLVSATITARILGPADKGTLSTLLFIQVIVSYSASIGLPDAAIVLVGQREATRQQMLSVIAPVLGLSYSVGILAFLSFGLIVDWSAIHSSVMVGALLVPLVATTHVLSGLEYAAERIASATAVAVVIALVTAVGHVLFLLVMHMSILGGVIAAACGSATGALLLIGTLSRQGIRLTRPRDRDRSLIKKALALGIGAQAATLLLALSQRADLLMVYGLAGEDAAGRYTIALTLSQLASYAPLALVSSSFPRLAQVPVDEVAALVALLSRLALAAALICVAILFPLIPSMVTVLFGDAYRPSIQPTLILLVGTLFWSELWLLARAALARGESTRYFVAFLMTVSVMLLGDFALVPRFGIIGAAVASLFAPVVGIAISARPSSRHGRLRLADHIPRAADFVALKNEGMDVVRALDIRLGSRSR